MRTILNAVVLGGMSLSVVGGCLSLSLGDTTGGTGAAGQTTTTGGSGGNADEGNGDEVVVPMNGTGPSSVDATSSGTTSGTPELCPFNPTTDPQEIVTVPDPTRGVDSAIYARAALRRHLAPDPSVLRLNDFLNLYGATRDFAGAPPNGEVEYLYSEGVIEARFPMRDAPSHTQRSFVVLVDTSVSMQSGFSVERALVKAVAGKLDGNQGDELRILGWSNALQTIYEGPPTTDLDGWLDAGFAKPGGSSDLTPALQKALAAAISTSSPEKHVLVLTDGGANVDGAANLLGEYAAQKIHIDVALIALGDKLADGKAPGKAIAYNQGLVSELTGDDSARLVVTDVPGNDGKTDVDSLVGSRFEDFFGTALDSPRATFFIPSMLKFVSSGLVAPSTGQLFARGVGYGRMLTLRVRVDDQSHKDPTALPPACSAQTISAVLDGSPTPAIGPLSQPPTKLGLTRSAVVAYVGALRTPSKTTFAAGQTAIDAAHVATCAAGPSDSLCIINQELRDLILLHPANQ